jgi:retron-type reverse transcriptase
MSRVARRIGDKRLLRIIRRFLEAELLQHGVCVERYEGTPQGGQVSPLLANLLLDDLDKELEYRGAQVLPLRRRLQHLRAVPGRRRTRAGIGDEVP